MQSSATVQGESTCPFRCTRPRPSSSGRSATRCASGCSSCSPSATGRCTRCAPRSRSTRRWRPSRRTCRPAAIRPTRAGCRSAWVATTPAPSASCRGCAARRQDRQPGDILAEIEALVAEGVEEITLLGQNVNAYGVEFGDRFAFGKLLRSCGEIEGLERERFTSPHPAAFTDDVIAAMAETPNVMPQTAHAAAVGLGLGAQAMRRSYRSERYLGIIDTSGPPCPTPRSPPTSSSASRARPRRTSRRRSRSSSVPILKRVHLPVLDPGGNTSRDDDRPGAEGRGPGALRAIGRAPGRGVLDGEPNPGGPGRRGAGRARRGAQGRSHRAAVRPGPRQPPGPLRGARGRRAPRPGDVATVGVPTARRTTWWPTAG